MAGHLVHGRNFTRLYQVGSDGPYELDLDEAEDVSNTTWARVAEVLAERGVPAEALPVYHTYFNLEESRIREQCEQVRSSLENREPLPELHPAAFVFNQLLHWLAAGEFFFFARA